MNRAPAIAHFDAKTSYDGALSAAAAFNRKVHLVWIGAGTAEDRIHRGALALHEALGHAGAHNVFYESPGAGHEFQTWRRALLAACGESLPVAIWQL
jgi:enterochelin esterase family protein